MINYGYKLFLILFILGLCGCEPFIGYDYDAEVQDNSIRISGKVRNIFTGEPVDQALVEIGISKTFSDQFGNYSLFFELGTDENRDKPVDVLVSAEDYGLFHDQFIVYNEDKTYDVDLTYVSPIIMEATLSPNGAYLNCDVLVHDYQGFNDIVFVQGSFYYILDGSPEVKQIDHTLEFIEMRSAESALFRCRVLLYLDLLWHLPNKDNYFNIYAEDRDGNSDTRRFK